MKALVRTSDKTVGEFFPDSASIALEADKVVVTRGDDTLTFPDDNDTTMSVVEGLEQPADFQPHKYEIVDGVLSVVDGWTDLIYEIVEE